MGEKMFVEGNEAIGWGAIAAGCLHFFGYPITPQNEITEFFARELPKRGGCFVQSEAEFASIALLYGGASTGVRAMTSTASPGWSLMQEGISCLANAELPCVIVDVQRGGPGQGSVTHSQMDYFSATRGGGHGGYKTIVLAPHSVQESHDLMQLAFYLADKYRNPVVVLSDGVLGRTMESLEMKTLDFGPLPEKDWAVKGSAEKGGLQSRIICAQGTTDFPPYVTVLERYSKKWEEMRDNEVRYEAYQADEAALLLVAFGYVARSCKEAVNMARSQGLKLGLIRPITLWPFPYHEIRKRGLKGANFLVVEDNLGQMVDDVRLGLEGKAEVHFLGALARHVPTSLGMIMPDRVLEEAKSLL